MDQIRQPVKIRYRYVFYIDTVSAKKWFMIIRLCSLDQSSQGMATGNVRLVKMIIRTSGGRILVFDNDKRE